MLRHLTVLFHFTLVFILLIDFNISRSVSRAFVCLVTLRLQIKCIFFKLLSIYKDPKVNRRERTSCDLMTPTLHLNVERETTSIERLASVFIQHRTRNDEFKCL